MAIGNDGTYLTVPWGRLFNYPLNQTCAIDFCYYSITKLGNFDNVTILSNNSFKIRSGCNDQLGFDEFQGSVTCRTIGGIVRTQNIRIGCGWYRCDRFFDLWVSHGYSYLTGYHYEIN